MKRLRLLAVVLLLLSGLGLLAHQVSFPFQQKVRTGDLTPDNEGVLYGDFSPGWPLEIHKRSVEKSSITMEDGTSLRRYPGLPDLVKADTEAGFCVHRQDVFVRFQGGSQPAADTTLSVTLPVRASGLGFWIPFSLAITILLGSWFWPGLKVCIKRGRRLPLKVSAVSLVVAGTGAAGMFFFTGLVVWLSLLFAVVGLLIATATLVKARAEAMQTSSRLRGVLLRTALLLGTVLLCFSLVEAFLGLVGTRPVEGKSGSEQSGEWFLLPGDVVERANARTDVLTLPDAWQKSDRKLEGATSAYTWHGALHVKDRWGFRRLNGPFPAKDPETCRILVVGDSMTYGVGIDEEWTFSSLLQKGLRKTHRVEVINLGRPGYQSQDILGVLTQFRPQLDPDLIVYAVCLNDLLISGPGQYDAYPFPLPKKVKRYFLERTSLARLFDDGWQNLLLALDVRQDFIDDVLEGDPERFASDVAAMNRPVLESRRPPITGIVFHQMPGGDPRAWDLVGIAEQAMEDAGFNVISVEPWKTRFKERVFPVSRWEGHPNELAHSLVAELLYERLLQEDLLSRYRIEK